ncbi:MAG: MFS transporter [Candidatus Paceibacterota bacterium]|jgi:MFS family permease
MNEPKPILGLPRNIFFLGLVSMFNDFSTEMVQSIMPIFITVVLGAPIIAVGLIEGFADALASILKIFFGWLSDKLNQRKSFAVYGYLLSVSTRPFYALATTYGHVFGLRALDRVGKGMRDAPRDALISESTTPETISRSFGYHRMMDKFGGILGPLAAFLILPLVFNSYHFIFLIAFGVGTLSILSFLLVKEIKHPESEKAPKFDLKLLRSNRRFVVFLISVFVFGLGALPLPLLLLRSPEVGLGNSSVPFFYFVSNFAFVLASIPFGRFADSFGKRKIVSLGFLAAFLAYVGLIFAHSFIALFIIFILFGFYDAATDGIQRAMVARLVDPQIRATGQGFLNAAIGISALLAGGIGGGLWTYISAEAAFVYAATMSLAGLTLFLILMNVRFREQ